VQTMTRDEYIFNDAASATELERLQMLESVLDDKTRQWLLAEGRLVGRRCLEVGAGAGSIAAWLASEVGPFGETVAMDTNVRFLGRLGNKVRVVEGELGVVSAPTESFDLVHARYVLIHNADAGAVLDAMLQALKPGGLLVLEEPDFSAAAALVGPAEMRRAFTNVTRAIEATFASRGMNYAFGASLPGLVEARVPKLVAVEYDCPVLRGASKLAEMMRLSALTLRDKYVATGLATPADVAGYAEFAASPGCWGVYYATVRVLAHKSAA
jgi:ubiquinone/menaquinone biosynthesis C-methylase UbiE